MADEPEFHRNADALYLGLLRLHDAECSIQKFHSEYKFIKNPKLGFIVGFWCFAFTILACILGMLPKVDYAVDPQSWIFQLISNIVTPIVLILLGMILPMIAKREQQSINE